MGDHIHFLYAVNAGVQYLINQWFSNIITRHKNHQMCIRNKNEVTSAR